MGCEPTSRRPPVAIVMPALSAPPPPFTSSTIVRKGLVVTDVAETLGDVHDRLREALARGGYSETAVYAFADDGFAVVTRMEAALDDGSPATNRWPVRRPRFRAKAFDVEDLRQLLFNAPPARYRVIVFVVTARPLAKGAEAQPIGDVDEEDLADGKLPKALRDRAVPSNARCEALIYELVRPRDLGQPAQRLQTSEISAEAHLVGARLWTRQELHP